MCVEAKAAEARKAVEVLAAAATVAEGQEVAEKGVAVLEAVATARSERGGEDECALSMSKKRVCQSVKEIHEVFAAFALPMQAEFPRFGGLRSEICRLAPCIMVHYLATTAYYRW
jgi:hypothetical protein